MNKLEREKLHTVLSEMNKKLVALEGSQIMIGNLVEQLSLDVKSLLLVVQETQHQVRTSHLRAVPNARRNSRKD